MAKQKYYAWSRIRYSANRQGEAKNDGEVDKRPIRGHNHVEIGQEVTPELLGIDEKAFLQLINSGAVRQYEYPAPDNWKGSPIQYLKHQTKLVEQAAQQLTGNVSALPTGVTRSGIDTTESENDPTGVAGIQKDLEGLSGVHNQEALNL